MSLWGHHHACSWQQLSHSHTAWHRWQLLFLHLFDWQVFCSIAALQKHLFAALFRSCIDLWKHLHNPSSLSSYASQSALHLADLYTPPAEGFGL